MLILFIFVSCTNMSFAFIPYPLRTPCSHAFCHFLLQATATLFERVLCLRIWQARGASKLIPAKASLQQYQIGIGRYLRIHKWQNHKVALHISLQPPAGCNLLSTGNLFTYQQYVDFLLVATRLRRESAKNQHFQCSCPWVVSSHSW